MFKSPLSDDSVLEGISVTLEDISKLRRQKNKEVVHRTEKIRSSINLANDSDDDDFSIGYFEPNTTMKSLRQADIQGKFERKNALANTVIGGIRKPNESATNIQKKSKFDITSKINFDFTDTSYKQKSISLQLWKTLQSMEHYTKEIFSASSVSELMTSILDSDKPLSALPISSRPCLWLSSQESFLQQNYQISTQAASPNVDTKYTLFTERKDGLRVQLPLSSCVAPLRSLWPDRLAGRGSSDGLVLLVNPSTAAATHLSEEFLLSDESLWKEVQKLFLGTSQRGGAVRERSDSADSHDVLLCLRIPIANPGQSSARQTSRRYTASSKDKESMPAVEWLGYGFVFVGIRFHSDGQPQDQQLILLHAVQYFQKLALAIHSKLLSFQDSSKIPSLGLSEDGEHGEGNRNPLPSVSRGKVTDMIESLKEMSATTDVSKLLARLRTVLSDLIPDDDVSCILFDPLENRVLVRYEGREPSRLNDDRRNASSEDWEGVDLSESTSKSLSWRSVLAHLQQASRSSPTSIPLPQELAAQTIFSDSELKSFSAANTISTLVLPFRSYANKEEDSLPVNPLSESDWQIFFVVKANAQSESPEPSRVGELPVIKTLIGHGFECLQKMRNKHIADAKASLSKLISTALKFNLTNKESLSSGLDNLTKLMMFLLSDEFSSGTNCRKVAVLLPSLCSMTGPSELPSNIRAFHKHTILSSLGSFKHLDRRRSGGEGGEGYCLYTRDNERLQEMGLHFRSLDDCNESIGSIAAWLESHHPSGIFLSVTPPHMREAVNYRKYSKEVSCVDMCESCLRELVRAVDADVRSVYVMPLRTELGASSLLFHFDHNFSYISNASDRGKHLLQDHLSVLRPPIWEQVIRDSGLQHSLHTVLDSIHASISNLHKRNELEIWHSKYEKSSQIVESLLRKQLKVNSQRRVFDGWRAQSLNRKISRNYKSVSVQTVNTDTLRWWDVSDIVSRLLHRVDEGDDAVISELKSILKSIFPFDTVEVMSNLSESSSLSNNRFVRQPQIITAILRPEGAISSKNNNTAATTERGGAQSQSSGPYWVTVSRETLNGDFSSSERETATELINIGISVLEMIRKNNEQSSSVLRMDQLMSSLDDFMNVFTSPSANPNSTAFISSLRDLLNRLCEICALDDLSLSLLTSLGETVVTGTRASHNYVNNVRWYEDRLLKDVVELSTPTSVRFECNLLSNHHRLSEPGEGNGLQVSKITLNSSCNDSSHPGLQESKVLLPMRRIANMLSTVLKQANRFYNLNRNYQEEGVKVNSLQKEFMALQTSNEQLALKAQQTTDDMEYVQTINEFLIMGSTCQSLEDFLRITTQAFGEKIFKSEVIQLYISEETDVGERPIYKRFHRESGHETDSVSWKKSFSWEEVNSIPAFSIVEHKTSHRLQKLPIQTDAQIFPLAFLLIYQQNGNISSFLRENSGEMKEVGRKKEVTQQSYDAMLFRAISAVMATTLDLVRSKKLSEYNKREDSSVDSLYQQIHTLENENEMLVEKLHQLKNDVRSYMEAITILQSKYDTDSSNHESEILELESNIQEIDRIVKRLEVENDVLKQNLDRQRSTTLSLKSSINEFASKFRLWGPNNAYDWLGDFIKRFGFDTMHIVRRDDRGLLMGGIDAPELKNLIGESIRSGETKEYRLAPNNSAITRGGQKRKSDMRGKDGDLGMVWCIPNRLISVWDQADVAAFEIVKIDLSTGGDLDDSSAIEVLESVIALICGCFNKDHEKEHQQSLSTAEIANLYEFRRDSLSSMVRVMESIWLQSNSSDVKSIIRSIEISIADFVKQLSAHAFFTYSCHIWLFQSNPANERPPLLPTHISSNLIDDKSMYLLQYLQLMGFLDELSTVQRVIGTARGQRLGNVFWVPLRNGIGDILGLCRMTKLLMRTSDLSSNDVFVNTSTRQLNLRGSSDVITSDNIAEEEEYCLVNLTRILAPIIESVVTHQSYSESISEARAAIEFLQQSVLDVEKKNSTLQRGEERLVSTHSSCSELLVKCIASRLSLDQVLLESTFLAKRMTGSSIVFIIVPEDVAHAFESQDSMDRTAAGGKYQLFSSEKEGFEQIEMTRGDWELTVLHSQYCQQLRLDQNRNSTGKSSLIFRRLLHRPLFSERSSGEVLFAVPISVSEAHQILIITVKPDINSAEAQPFDEVDERTLLNIGNIIKLSLIQSNPEIAAKPDSRNRIRNEAAAPKKEPIDDWFQLQCQRDVKEVFNDILHRNDSLDNEGIDQHKSGQLFEQELSCILHFLFPGSNIIIMIVTPAQRQHVLSNPDEQPDTDSHRLAVLNLHSVQKEQIKFRSQQFTLTYILKEVNDKKIMSALELIGEVESLEWSDLFYFRISPIQKHHRDMVQVSSSLILPLLQLVDLMHLHHTGSLVMMKTEYVSRLNQLVTNNQSYDKILEDLRASIKEMKESHKTEIKERTEQLRCDYERGLIRYKAEIEEDKQIKHILVGALDISRDLCNLSAGVSMDKLIIGTAQAMDWVMGTTTSVCIVELDDDSAQPNVGGSQLYNKKSGKQRMKTVRWMANKLETFERTTAFHRAVESKKIIVVKNPEQRHLGHATVSPSEEEQFGELEVHVEDSFEDVGAVPFGTVVTPVILKSRKRHLLLYISCPSSTNQGGQNINQYSVYCWWTLRTTLSYVIDSSDSKNMNAVQIYNSKFQQFAVSFSHVIRSSCRKKLQQAFSYLKLNILKATVIRNIEENNHVVISQTHLRDLQRSLADWSQLVKTVSGAASGVKEGVQGFWAQSCRILFTMLASFVQVRGCGLILRHKADTQHDMSLQYSFLGPLDVLRELLVTELSTPHRASPTSASDTDMASETSNFNAKGILEEISLDDYGVDFASLCLDLFDGRASMMGQGDVRYDSPGDPVDQPTVSYPKRIWRVKRGMSPESDEQILLIPLTTSRDTIAILRVSILASDSISTKETTYRNVISLPTSPEIQEENLTQAEKFLTNFADVITPLLMSAFYVDQVMNKLGHSRHLLEEQLSILRNTTQARNDEQLLLEKLSEMCNFLVNVVAEEISYETITGGVPHFICTHLEPELSRLLQAKVKILFQQIHQTETNPDGFHRHSPMISENIYTPSGGVLGCVHVYPLGVNYASHLGDEDLSTATLKAIMPQVASLISVLYHSVNRNFEYKMSCQGMERMVKDFESDVHSQHQQIVLSKHHMERMTTTFQYQKFVSNTYVHILEVMESIIQHQSQYDVHSMNSLDTFHVNNTPFQMIMKEIISLLERIFESFQGSVFIRVGLKHPLHQSVVTSTSADYPRQGMSTDSNIEPLIWSADVFLQGVYGTSLQTSLKNQNDVLFSISNSLANTCLKKDDLTHIDMDYLIHPNSVVNQLSASLSVPLKVQVWNHPLGHSSNLEAYDSNHRNLSVRSGTYGVLQMFLIPGIGGNNSHLDSFEEPVAGDETVHDREIHSELQGVSALLSTSISMLQHVSLFQKRAHALEESCKMTNMESDSVHIVVEVWRLRAEAWSVVTSISNYVLDALRDTLNVSNTEFFDGHGIDETIDEEKSLQHFINTLILISKNFDFLSSNIGFQVMNSLDEPFKPAGAVAASATISLGNTGCFAEVFCKVGSIPSGGDGLSEVASDIVHRISSILTNAISSINLFTKKPRGLLSQGHSEALETEQRTKGDPAQNAQSTNSFRNAGYMLQLTDSLVHVYNTSVYSLFSYFREELINIACSKPEYTSSTRQSLHTEIWRLVLNGVQSSCDSLLLTPFHCSIFERYLDENSVTDIAGTDDGRRGISARYYDCRARPTSHISVSLGHQLEDSLVYNCFHTGIPQEKPIVLQDEDILCNLINLDDADIANLRNLRYTKKIRGLENSTGEELDHTARLLCLPIQDGMNSGHVVAVLRLIYTDISTDSTSSSIAKQRNNPVSEYVRFDQPNITSPILQLFLNLHSDMASALLLIKKYKYRNSSDFNYSIDSLKSAENKIEKLKSNLSHIRRLHRLVGEQTIKLRDIFQIDRIHPTSYRILQDPYELICRKILFMVKSCCSCEGLAVVVKDSASPSSGFRVIYTSYDLVWPDVPINSYGFLPLKSSRSGSNMLVDANNKTCIFSDAEGSRTLSLVETCILSSQSMFVADLSSDPRYIPAIDGICSKQSAYLIVPLPKVAMQSFAVDPTPNNYDLSLLEARISDGVIILTRSRDMTSLGCDELIICETVSYYWSLCLHLSHDFDSICNSFIEEGNS